MAFGNALVELALKRPIRHGFPASVAVVKIVSLLPRSALPAPGVVPTIFDCTWFSNAVGSKFVRRLLNCRVCATGNVFFTLKDETSQIKAIMFRTAVRYLRFTPEDGLHVIARGRLSLAARARAAYLFERLVRLRGRSGQRYGFTKYPTVSVWFPLASIASTSNVCGPDGSDATNSGGTVTFVAVPGTVT